MTNVSLLGMIVGSAFGAAAFLPFVVAALRRGRGRGRQTGGGSR